MFAQDSLADWSGLGETFQSHDADAAVSFALGSSPASNFISHSWNADVT